MRLILTFLLLSFHSAYAHESIRLDDFSSEDIKYQNYKAHLYITENCSVCASQIEILKSCFENVEVAAYISGNEEKLRTYIKRKKLPFKTFLLTDEVKNDLKFGKASPSISFITKDGMKNIVGLQTCDQIKAGSEVPNK